MEMLLSGVLGAIIATIISVWYQHKSEQIRDRKCAIMAITDWLDNIYVNLQALSAHKEELISNQIESMPSDEYRTMNNQLRILILSNKILLQTAITYGQSEIFNKITVLHDQLSKAARIFWNSRSNSWQQDNNQIMQIFKEKIDPVRTDLTNNLINSLNDFSLLSIFNNWKKYLAHKICKKN